MTFFLVTIFGIYFSLMLALIIGWKKVISKKNSASKINSFSITVIVPFRNEVLSLPDIATDLKAQLYPSKKFTVFFIDDHSDDQSVEVLRTQISGQSNFNLVSMPADLQGKKKAIDYGISMSDGEIIVTTDADCRLSHEWLRLISDAFQGQKTKLVSGGVKIEEDQTFFSKLQAIEFMSLIGSGAATLGLGFPTMCNGANLAYRRSAYLDVNGFEGNFNVASGDDEFLMRKINSKFPDSISFLSEQAAVVKTQAQASVNDFFNQRLRWAGKWKYNESVTSKVLALFILFFQITFLSSIVLGIVGVLTLKLFLLLLSVKIVVDVIFFRQVSSFMKQKINPVYFLVLQFIYPIYVVVIGFLSQIGSYYWKGRSLAHRM